MRHATRTALLVLAGLLLFPLPARAEDGDLPAPLLDETDLRVHRLETTCNTYVLTCKRTLEFVVVDPGLGIVSFLEAYERAGHTLKAVWLTHEHGDHLAGLGALAKKREVPIVAHAAARRAIEGVRTNGKAWGMADAAPLPPVVPNTSVAHGDPLRVGRLAWSVLHLPGHSPGSVGYVLPGRVAVVGDVLFRGSIGRTDLPTSDPVVFRASLARLWDLPDEVHALPGHGPRTTIGAEKRTNRLFQDFVRAGRGAPRASPWLGVELDATTPGLGLRVRRVLPESPASRAGLGAGDVLVRADDVSLAGPATLGEVLGRHAVGDTMTVVVRRGTTTLTRTVRLAARPAR